MLRLRSGHLKHGSGTDTIDGRRQARGIEGGGRRGHNVAAVAEQALALLLACANRWWH